jgi:Methyltransferase domain
MGFYGDQVLPPIINAACGMKATGPLRERVCEGLEGEVVEIGFGSGLNVPFYPDSVRRVAAVEPAKVGWKLAAKRVSGSSVPVERSGLDGQSLPFEDDSFETAVDLDDVRDPRYRAGAGGGSARAQARGQAALRRARLGAR